MNSGRHVPYLRIAAGALPTALVSERRQGMVSRKSRWLAAAIVLLAAAAAPRAQEKKAEDPSVALTREVAELKQAVREIASALRELLKRQEISILMSRIEMEARSIAPLERDVRNGASERDSLTGEIKMMEARLESLGSEKEEGQRTPGARPSPDDLRAKEEMTLRLRALKERLGSVELKLAEMENDLAKRQQGIREWEELVDKRLEAP
jgi:hypothetical protein